MLDLHFSHKSKFDPVSALSKISNFGDWVALRYTRDTTQHRVAQNGAPLNNTIEADAGVMIEVMIDGHLAYSGTGDLSPAGIEKAAGRAASLAKAIGKSGVFNYTHSLRPPSKGSYKSPRKINLDQASVRELTHLLIESTRKQKVSNKIVSALASAMISEVETVYLSSSGTDIHQNFLYITTNYSATANDGHESQTRTGNGMVAQCYQTGMEVFTKDKILQDSERLGHQALELLSAPNCPDETMDLLIAPDQMYLQIHESIGHPLELDRILGDERNYAGWSFVKLADFGKLQYGSKLLNVVFDPSAESEFASYNFDDCGQQATREYLIEDGVLMRGLGGLESQARMRAQGFSPAGVANFRSANWNRAPIDRMANLNIEPGHSSLEQMISQVERGIYIDSNRSWSIDDYRNKFQFGCEYGRLIENGKLTKVVKNPNYRGSSLPFWRSLKAVGNKSTYEMYGSPYCGKGEPSQVIRVGHASPACLFDKVQVFGGGK